MGLIQTWSCDECASENREPDPIGWLIQGRHRAATSPAAVTHELYFCRAACAAQYFQQFYVTEPTAQK